MDAETLFHLTRHGIDVEGLTEYISENPGYLNPWTQLGPEHVDKILVDVAQLLAIHQENWTGYTWIVQAIQGSGVLTFQDAESAHDSEYVMRDANRIHVAVTRLNQDLASIGSQWYLQQTGQASHKASQYPVYVLAQTTTET